MYMNQMQSIQGRIKIQEYYENTQQIRLNQLQAKCSHNSFSQSDYYRQLAFNDQKLQQGGCLMLEFDLALKKGELDEKYTIYVAHDENEEPQYTLAHDLKSVYYYHVDYPQHLPIFIGLSVLQEAKQLNLVTRGYLLNTESLYKMYKGLGMNFLCTDKLFDTNYTIPI
ncbi:hypothetical protein PPERSA_11045 [Pseudocohnilembus persalinus]|uniref:PLC-like phosphodiesterase, TIM beta/alpha-barrel domain n=1 Tax=Pseudocohnilembus persalinus TaxID=266149 RepID=A0A0V0R006_PSEPJ|nr:hypothetical protein PPERSA_11045 [Pseudocohnilembus persalinus]|eukprot:KRX07496.1 hypothetical protein PPERSA_11045 [Pseudocohnilembus persalinus]